MRYRDDTLACRNCKRRYSADRLDRQRWCRRCREEVVRRATRVSRLVSIGGTLLLILWIAMEVGRSPRFLFLWIALVIITYFVLFTLSRRVAFEVIRGRGVPVPAEGEGE